MFTTTGTTTSATSAQRSICSLVSLRRLGDLPVLELGVGTGRLAIPLAARGVDVVGLDSSAGMLVEVGRQ